VLCRDSLLRNRTVSPRSTHLYFCPRVNAEIRLKYKQTHRNLSKYFQVIFYETTINVIPDVGLVRSQMLRSIELLNILL
jgi:hypothetical protein